MQYCIVIEPPNQIIYIAAVINTVTWPIMHLKAYL